MSMSLAAAGTAGTAHQGRLLCFPRASLMPRCSACHMTAAFKFQNEQAGQWNPAESEPRLMPCFRRRQGPLGMACMHDIPA